jgi:hypothetical protein
MNTEALFLFLILLLGLVLCSFLGGNCGNEGFTGEFSGTITSKQTDINNKNKTSSTNGASTSSNVNYDNYNHFNGSSTQLASGTSFYGPNGGSVVVNTDSNGQQSLQVTLANGEQPMTFSSQQSSTTISKESYTNYYGNNGGGSNIKYESLQQPDNLTLSTQKISNTWRLYANWNSVPYATGYNVICNFPNGLSEEKNINSLSTFFQINAIGAYFIYVSALSNTQPINNTFYFNSDQSVESLFFINNDNETLIQFDRSYMYDITINN